jgi:hypothetical protein
MPAPDLRALHPAYPTAEETLGRRWAPTPDRPPRLVQFQAAGGASLASINVTPPKDVTAGNALFVVVGTGDGISTVTTVADSLGNAFQSAVATQWTTSPPQGQFIYYATAIDGGSDIISVQLDSAMAYLDVRVAELTPLLSTQPIDDTASAAGDGPYDGGTITVGCGPLTTHATNELLFVACTADGAALDAGTGFTLIEVTADGDEEESEIAVMPGNYSATADQVSGNWVLQMVALRGAAP